VIDDVLRVVLDPNQATAWPVNPVAVAAPSTVPVSQKSPALLTVM